MEEFKKQTGEIVIYQPDEETSLEVRLDDETVWLTQEQIAKLFGVKRPAVTKHIRNIYVSAELEETSVCSILEHTASDGKKYRTQFYNLDMILSIGYRINSRNAMIFRRWASCVLKEYMFKGYVVAQKLSSLEYQIAEHDERLNQHEKELDLFIKRALSPSEGIFYDGQIFDAYTFVADLIRSARKSVVLIDNYVDDTVLKLLLKRDEDVSATIYTKKVSDQLALDVEKHNQQYSAIEIVRFNKSHDRFLLIDETVYHIGASLKDLGRKWFAFTRMNDLTSSDILFKVGQ